MTAGSQYQLEQTASLLAHILSRTAEFNLAEREKLKDLHTSLVLLCQKDRSGGPFHEWLDQQKERQDRIGQLARMAVLDQRWPRGSHASLTPYVERLRLINLTKGAVQMPGRSGSEMVELYLYPAWDEYTAASTGRQLRLVSAGR
ncbi:MAG: hypothetical protein LAP40_13690 [Acidobacteriia bacterium]|nr:hypothetical protein [Terriglobia bacterium]